MLLPENTSQIPTPPDTPQCKWACEIHLETLCSIPNGDLTLTELEYCRELQSNNSRPISPHPRKKAKGNNHKAQPKPANVSFPNDDKLPHKKTPHIPECAQIINPGHSSANQKKTTQSPRKNHYIPYCLPTFQNKYLEEGEISDASTPLQYTMIDANTTLPHKGPTVIVELIGATQDMNNAFSQLHNLHYGTTQTGDTPEPPLTTPIPYTTKLFPKLIPSYVTLFGNLHEVTLKQVQNYPQHYIAIIPFGAGQHLTQDYPGLSKDFETFLKSLGFHGSDHLQVVCPTPNLSPDPQAHFAKPFPYLLLHSPEPLC